MPAETASDTQASRSRPVPTGASALGPRGQRRRPAAGPTPGRTPRPRAAALALGLALVVAVLPGCRGPSSDGETQPGSDARPAGADGASDASTVAAAAHRGPLAAVTAEAIPRAAVETGGGRIELVALWRRGPFVRLVVSGRADVDGFELAGRFGPVLAPMARALLVDPATRTAYRVLAAPGAAGRAGECRCSTTAFTPRLPVIYYADFRVPEDVHDVLVLGDASPPLGRQRIAADEPDLTRAGY